MGSTRSGTAGFPMPVLSDVTDNRRVKLASESIEEDVLGIQNPGNPMDLCDSILQLISRATTDWLGGEDGGPPPKNIRLQLFLWGWR